MLHKKFLVCSLYFAFLYGAVKLKASSAGHPFPFQNSTNTQVVGVKYFDPCSSYKRDVKEKEMTILELIREYRGGDEKLFLNEIRIRLEKGERLDLTNIEAALISLSGSAHTWKTSPLVLAERSTDIPGILLLILRGDEIPDFLYPAFITQITNTSEKKIAENQHIYYPIRVGVRLKALCQEFEKK